MHQRLHVILGLLFVLALGYDLFAWGGLSRTPALGHAVTEATTRELALASVYVPAGKALLAVPGLESVAVYHAEREFGGVQRRVLDNPAAAMETLVRDMPMLVRIAYYGAPVLLLAFVLALWRRPRQVKQFGRR